VSTGDLTDLAVDLIAVSGRFTRLAAQESDLTISRALWRALSQIEDLGPMRVSDLARIDRCSQPTATTTVRQLEAAGWVMRTPDPSDRRAVQIEVTELGREQLAHNRRVAGRRLARRISELSPADRKALGHGVRVLHQLTAHPARETPVVRT
jgi:DNA-binding MarR family transcriptional regulator